MAGSDSCIKKNTASQHCSAYFLRNALLEFRTNIRGLGLLREYLAEEKSPPPFRSKPLCQCLVFSRPHTWQRGKAAHLFSLRIRWISQPTCLNAVVEDRHTTGFSFAPEGASLTYFTHNWNIIFVILSGKIHAAAV